MQKATGYHFYDINDTILNSLLRETICLFLFRVKLVYQGRLVEMVYQDNEDYQVPPVQLVFQEKMATKEILGHPVKRVLKVLKVQS